MQPSSRVNLMRDHHDDLPYIVIERHSAGVAPFFWGALIGAGVALLLAPRSGVETQDEIRQGVRRVRNVAEDKVEAARSTMNRTRERLENQMETVRDQFDTVRERLEMRVDEARNALDTSRPDAHERVSSVGSDLRDVGRTSDEMAASQLDQGVDVVFTEETEQAVEGRSDVG